MKLPNGYGSVVKLSGKRRRPYQVRKTVGWHYDEVKDKQLQDMITIGYAATRAEGLQMLADYNNNPFDTKAAKMTFSDVYEEWSKRKFPTISESNVKGYTASYKSCESLYNKVFKDIKLVDLQTVIDTCGKNFPTLKQIKVLFNQLFDYALKNDICNKYYSSFVDIAQYKDCNPNKYDRNKKVPTADKVLPYYKTWYESCPEYEYLLHTEDGKHFEYRNYYDSYFKPLIEQLNINRTPSLLPTYMYLNVSRSWY